jgi:hypothetical protein
MADETPNIESQMEAELQSLFAGSPPATGSESGEGTQTPSDAKPGTVPPPTAPATETPEEVPTEELTEQDKILKALDDLDKPAEGEQKPEDKPQAPQLSEDQQIILNNIPDRHTAETLVQIANNHVAFEEAFLEGDFDRVEGMFTHWNKQAYDVFTEKMYEKYVAKDGEWVKRFIAEQEAKANGDEYTYKKTSILEQKIAQLENQLKGRQQQESTQQAQQREQQVFQNYNSELE